MLRRRWGSVAVATILGGLALYVGWNLLHTPDDPQLEALRRQGFPTTLKELNSWYVFVPPEENQALACEYAFAQLQGSLGLPQHFEGKASLFSHRGSLAPEEQRFLAGVLMTNAAAMELLHSLSATNRSRYPIDLTQGFLVLLPHLSKLKECVQLLVAEALVRTAQGQPDEAIDSLAAAGRVADSLAQEPVLISYLVRASCWRTIVAGQERLLNSTVLSESQLARLQTSLQEAIQPQDMVRPLTGELVFGLAVFEQLPAQAQAFNGGSGGGSTPVQNLLLGLYKASGLLGRDRNCFLGTMVAEIEAAQAPFPERRQRGRAATAAAAQRYCFFSRMLLPALDRAYSRDVENVARVRVAQTALAVERFRRAHAEALPLSLEQLAPAFMAGVPADPCDGAPLRFRKLQAGFIVYSVGADGKDDGGAELLPGTSSASNHDIAFAVER